jgi:hypothetical protein
VGEDIRLCLRGSCGGSWISSIYLAALVSASTKKVSLSKRYTTVRVIYVLAESPTVPQSLAGIKEASVV